MLGFALVAVELGRVQQREFGAPVWFDHLQGWLRNRLGKTSTVEGSTSATGRTAASARGKARTPAGRSVEQRLGALETNFARLDDEVDADRLAADNARATLLEQLELTRGDFDRQHQADEIQRKALLRTSITLQSWGTVCFVIGTIFSAIGGLS